MQKGKPEKGTRRGNDFRNNRAKRKPHQKPKVEKPKSNQIRLNKYIANSGLCSRREADMYIQVGSVTVNGKIINEMGYKVNPTDEVRFEGQRINPEPKAYVLLNKPKGFATTTSASKGNTVMDLVANASKSSIEPIGRLGRNATGLLLFTNDDEFMRKFTKKGVSRLFHIELDKNVKPADLQKIREGIKIGDKTIEIEEVSHVKNASKKEVGLKLKHIGNKVIRDLFTHLGYDVVKVDCVTIAHLTKKDLPRGRWRHLTEQELNTFKMI